MRGLWQHCRHRHGPGCSGQAKVAARGSHRAVEHAGLLRTNGTSSWRWRTITTCRSTFRSPRSPTSSAAWWSKACRSASSVGCVASSPGSTGANTKCTCACSSAGGAATAPARPAAAPGCGPRHWRCAWEVRTLPRFAPCRSTPPSRSSARSISRTGSGPSAARCSSRCRRGSPFCAP